MQFMQKINSVIRNSCALNVSCGDELCEGKERPDNLANGLLQQWWVQASLTISILPLSPIHSFPLFPLFSPSSTLTLLCLALLCECLKTSGPLLKYNINSIRSPSLPTLTPLIAAAGTYYCLWQGEVMTIYRDIYRCLYMYITIYTGPR